MVDKKRYEISILMGPCSQTRAEQALEELFMYTNRSRPALFPGAALGLRVWKDDDEIETLEASTMSESHR